MPECAICDKPIAETDDTILTVLMRVGKASKTVAVSHAACEGF